MNLRLSFLMVDLCRRHSHGEFTAMQPTPVGVRVWGGQSERGSSAASPAPCGGRRGVESLSRRAHQSVAPVGCFRRASRTCTACDFASAKVRTRKPVSVRVCVLFFSLSPSLSPELPSLDSESQCWDSESQCWDSESQFWGLELLSLSLSFLP